MGNVVEVAFGRTGFDVSQALLACRGVRDKGPRKGRNREQSSTATKQHVAMILALATDRRGRVVMTIEELSRRARRGRDVLLRAVRDLETEELLSRLESRGTVFEWNLETVAKLAKQVADEDAKFSTRSGENSSTHMGAFTTRLRIFRAAELAARSKKLGRQFSDRLSPIKDEAAAWLDDWSQRIETETGRTTEAIAALVLRKWLRFEGHTHDGRRYADINEGHPLSFLIAELQRNRPWRSELVAMLRREPAEREAPVSAVYDRATFERARAAFGGAR